MTSSSPNRLRKKHRTKEREMGKHIRKPKTTRDLPAVKDVSQPYLGVLTRSRTQALQRLLQSSSAAAAADDSPPAPEPDFLELRSRRVVRKTLQNSRKRRAPKQGSVSRDNESSELESSVEKACSEPAVVPIEPAVVPIEPVAPPIEPVAVPIEPAEEEDGRSEILDGGLEIEASLGENNLELEVRESRGTRESTPPSFITPVVPTRPTRRSPPGSSTRPRIRSPRAQDARTVIPTTREMVDFFAQFEQREQRRFIEKYNFDIVNDMPLPGRYEWEKIEP